MGFMPKPNWGAGDDDDGERESRNPTCNRCGATGLSWLHTGVRWALQDPDGRIHKCKQMNVADEF